MNYTERMRNLRGCRKITRLIPLLHCIEKSERKRFVFGILLNFWHNFIMLSFLWPFRQFLLLEEDNFTFAFLEICMQLIDDISHTKQKNLQFYFSFPTEQESLEFVIIFRNAKNSLYLNVAVHSAFAPCFTQDIFIGFLTLLQKKIEIHKCLIPFVPVHFFRITGTVLKLVNGHFRFIVALTFCFLIKQGGDVFQAWHVYVSPLHHSPCFHIC